MVGEAGRVMGSVGDKVEILPGMTARTGYRVVVISFLAIFAILVLLIFYASLRSHSPALATLLFHIWIYVMAGALLNTAAWAGFQQYRAFKEIANGSTSLLFNTRPVDVVDTDSGLVVRTKNQKPLETRADLRKARQAALDASHALAPDGSNTHG